MKIVTLFVTFIGFFLAQEVSSYRVRTHGDVVIKTEPNGRMNCDSLICPEGTAQCHVTKRNDPNNFEIVVRRRKCLAQNLDVLQEEIVNEPNKHHSNVNADIMSGGGGGMTNGRPMTPQEKKEFDAFMKQTQQRIKSEIDAEKKEFDAFMKETQQRMKSELDEALNEAHSSLGPLLDGSFQAKLQKQIDDEIRKSLNF